MRSQRGKSPAIAFGSLAFDGTVNGPLANPVVAGQRHSFSDGRFGDNRLQVFQVISRYLARVPRRAMPR